MTQVVGRARGSSETSGGAKRQLNTVTDIRKEIVRQYRLADKKTKPANEAYCCSQMLMNAAKLMTETEPEIEVRALKAENEQLKAKIAELEALMEQLSKEPKWASWSQLAKPGEIRPS
jgi:ribosomal protein S8E